MAEASETKKGRIWRVLRLDRAPAPEQRPPLRRGLPKTRLELDLLKAWN